MSASVRIWTHIRSVFGNHCPDWASYLDASPSTLACNEYLRRTIDVSSFAQSTKVVVFETCRAEVGHTIDTGALRIATIPQGADKLFAPRCKCMQVYKQACINGWCAPAPMNTHWQVSACALEECACVFNKFGLTHTQTPLESKVPGVSFQIAPSEAMAAEEF